MKGYCACRGQPLPSELGLEVDLNRNTARRLDRTVKLRPQGAVVLSVLNRKPGRLITHEEVYRALWGGGEGPQYERNNVAVHISYLRKALVLLDLRITTITRRGFCLEPVKKVEEVAA